MLTIRLQRVGRKNQPVFRIVLAEKHRAATKKTVEQLGLYNPRSKEFTVKEERVKYWLEKHIELSPTVHNLFVTRKLIDTKKVKAWHPKKSPATAEATADKQASPLQSGGQAEQGEGVKPEAPAVA